MVLCLVSLMLSMITVRPPLVLLCVRCPHPVTPINYKDMRQRYLQLVINWIYGWFYFFKRYSQVPAKAALQLVRSTRGDPLSHAGEGKAKSWESNTQCAPNPPLAKQDKEILDAWFYSCKAEKCPEIPLQTCKGGKRKLGIQHKVPISPPYPKNTRKSLEFGSLP